MSNIRQQWNTSRTLRLVMAVATVCVTLGLLFTPTIYAAFNKQINYQGKLTNTLGVAVADGTYNMEFKLYTASTGGSPIWTETRISGDKVTVTNGLFSVMLGEVTSLAGVNFNQTLYLGVNIGGTGSPSWDGEMSPRKRLGAVPAAIEAENLGGAAASQYLRNDQAGAVTASSSGTLLAITQSGAGSVLDLYSGATNVFTVANGGNVGIGVASPTAFKLEVAGNVGPEADNTRDLGSLTKRWANVYATNFVGTITPSGFTAGSVVFAGSGGALSQDNTNFFFDDTNNRLGLGTATPATTLDVNGTTTVRGDILPGTSGTYNIGGTASQRFNTIFVSTVSGGNGGGVSIDGQTPNAIRLTANGSSQSQVLTVSNVSAFSSSSIEQTGLLVSTSINQSGTASYNGLKIAVTETATGSGAKYLINALAGASGTSQKFFVANDGSGYFASNVGIGDASPAALLTVGSGDLFQINSSGAIAAVTGITTTGGYTQSGTGANTFTGVTTFSDATDGSATVVNFTTTDLGMASNQELRLDFKQSTLTLARQAMTLFSADWGFNFYGYDAGGGGFNTTPIMTMRGTGRVGIGDTTPAAMLTVGSGDLFQVNSSGAIAAVTGITTTGGYTQSGSGANTFTGTIGATGHVGVGGTYVGAYGSEKLTVYGSLYARTGIVSAGTALSSPEVRLGAEGAGGVTGSTALDLSGGYLRINAGSAGASGTQVVGTLALATAPTTSAGSYTILTRNSSTGVVESISSTTMPSGSGTTNYVARWTGTNTLGTGVLYDNGTYVGIGTTNPQSQLVVGPTTGALSSISGITPVATFATSSSANHSIVIIEGNGGGSNERAGGLAFRSNRSANFAYNVASQVNDYLGFLAFDGFSTTTGTSRNGAIIQSQVEAVGATTVSGNFQFWTTNSSGTSAERMRISASGNVGIGTSTTTAAKLHVSRTTATGTADNTPLLKLSNTADGAYPYVVVRFDRYTTSGNQGGIILSFDNNGTQQAAIEYNSDIIGANEFRMGNYTANGYLSFLTAGALAANERMRITSTGNVGIGDTTPAAMFTVGNGDLFQVSSGGTVTLTTAPTTSAGTYTILTRNSSTGVVESVASTTFAGGSGTTNYVARWTGTNTLGTGAIQDDGTYVGIGVTPTSSYKLEVGGTMKVGATYTQTSSTYTGTFSISHSANNQIRLTNSGIGVFLEAGPGNVVSTGDQRFLSTARGALFGASFGGAALVANVGDVQLNTTSGSTLIGTTTDNAAGKLQVAGHAVPSTDNTYNLGSASYRWANVYATNIAMTSLTQGSVTFAGASGALSQDNANFFWDDTNNRLGIGTATSLGGKVHILPGSGEKGLIIGSSDNTSVQIETRASGGNATFQVGAGGYVYAGNGGPGAPVYAFILDTNTGMRNYDTDQLSLMTGGSDRLLIDASGNVGIGTTSPSAKLHVAAGTITSGTYAQYVTGTMPTTGYNYGANFAITGAGSGDGTTGQHAMNVNLAAGYTGSGYTAAGGFQNLSAGTGTGSTIGSQANYGLYGQTYGTTTGRNIGGAFEGGLGNTNIGVLGFSTRAKNSAVNVGVLGIAANTGTSPVTIGGIFTLGTTYPSLATSAALIADNGSTTSPIFLGRDNGASVFTVTDGGSVIIANTSTSSVGPNGSTGTLSLGYTDTGSGSYVQTVGNYSTAFGYAESGGYVVANGILSEVRGYASGSDGLSNFSHVDAASSYSMALGVATGGAYVVANADDSFVFGRADGSDGAGNVSYLATDGEASLAFGHVSGGGYVKGNGNSSLTFGSVFEGNIQGAQGSLAFGSIEGAAGASITAGNSSLAFGHIVSNDLITAGIGAFAGGYAYSNLGDIQATGLGSFAFGSNTLGNLIASGAGSFALGSGFTNSVANSFAVGYGSQQFTLDGTTGNVGIGTATPNVKLDISASTGGALATRPFIQFTDTAAQTNSRQWMIGNSGTNYGDLSFMVSTSNATNPTLEKMTLDRNGNLGIGDTTPAAMLTVGSGDLFQVNSSGAIAAATGITTSGNVTLSTAPTTSAGTYTILTRNSSTGVVESVASTLMPTGSGTTNYVARWTGTNTLGTGLLYDNGTSVGISTTTPTAEVANARLRVSGAGHVIVDNNFGFLSVNSTANGTGAGFDTTTTDGLDLYAGGAARLSIGSGGEVTYKFSTAPLSGQDWVLSSRSTGVLTLQAQTSGILAQHELYPKDGDGTDDVTYALFAKGTPSSLTNYEQFRFGYRSGTQAYVIGTSKGGTGADRDIRIGNGIDPSDIVIKATTGNVGIGTTSPVSKLSILTAPTASANYGTLSIGSGAFDGSTSGFFTGSASGTSLAVNEVSGYAGDLLSLQVAGVNRVKFSATGARISTETNGLRILTNGAGVGGITFTGGSLSSNTIMVGNTGFALMVENQNYTSTVAFTITTAAGRGTATSGNQDHLSLAGGFAPTSGTATFSMLGMTPVINQTGGANGITRGIYINPTLTAAADFRGLEIANNSGYGIYQSGASATNYFAGNTGIGSTTPFSGASVAASLWLGTSGGNNGNVVAGGGFATLGKTAPGSYGAVGTNFYLDSSGALKRVAADAVAIIDFGGGFVFRNAGVAAANSTISTTTLWTLNSSGHWVPGTNNTYDLGTTSAAARTVYAATNMIAPYFATDANQGNVGGTASTGVNLGSAGTGYPGVGYNIDFGTSVNTYNYKTTDTAFGILFGANTGTRMAFNVAALGTGATAITWTEAMSILTSGNVGIGDTTPAAMLTVGSGDLFQVNSSGAIAAATGITTSGNVTLSTAPTTSAGTYTILTRNSSTGVVESVASTLMPTGSGTTNYVARWTGTNTLGTGVIQDNGTLVGIGIAPGTYALNVNGTTNSVDAIRASGPSSTAAWLIGNSGGNMGTSLTNNIKRLTADAAWTQDNVSLPSWRVGMNLGGADAFVVGRSAAGSVTMSEFLTINSTGNATFAATNTTMVVNSTNSNAYKIALQSAGTAYGYLGATATNAFSVGDSTATERFSVSQAGAGTFTTSVTGSMFVLNGTTDSLSQGRFLFRSAEGATLTTKSGSSYDFTLYSPVSGEYVMTVVAGDNKVRLWDNVGIGTDPTANGLTVSGAGSFTGNLTAQGSTLTLGAGGVATNTINFRNSVSTEGYIMYAGTAMQFWTANTTRLVLGGATYTGIDVTGNSRVTGTGTFTSGVGVNGIVGNTTYPLQVSSGFVKTNTGLNLVAMFGSNEGAASSGFKFGFAGGASVGASYGSIQIGDNSTNGGGLALQPFGGEVWIGSNTDLGSYALQVTGNSVFVGTITSTDTGGATTLRIGTSSSAAGTDGTALGNSASAGGAQSTAVGYSSSAQNIGTTAVGRSAIAYGQYTTAIGYSATAGSVAASEARATALGGFATASGYFSASLGGYSAATNTNAVAVGVAAQSSGASAIAFGTSASATHNYAIAIGDTATTTAANQLVVGGSTAYINDIYFGKGVTNAAPLAVAINATGGSGTNIAGANLVLAGGKATGNAAGGTILFQTSTAGASGATLQSLTTRMEVGGATFTGVDITGDSRVQGSLTVRRSASADTPIRFMNNTDDNGFLEYSGTTMKLYTANTVRTVFGGATYTGVDVTGRSRISVTTAEGLRLTNTASDAPYIAWESSGSATRGYIGFGANLLTGASTPEMVIRSENTIKLAAGGNTLRVTLGGATYPGIDVAGNSRVTGTGYFTSNLSLGIADTGSASKARLFIAGGALTDYAEYGLAISGALSAGRLTSNSTVNTNAIHTYMDNSSVEISAGSTLKNGIAINGNSTNTAPSTIQFFAANSERMRINASGELQLGSTSDLGAYALQVTGDSDFVGTVTLATAPTTSAGTYTILTRNSSTGVVESISSTAMPGGSGTTDYVARWTGTNTLGTGVIRDNGTNVGIGGAPDASYKLSVAGSITTTGIRSESSLYVDRTVGDLANYLGIIARGAAEASNFGNAVGNGAIEINSVGGQGIVMGTMGNAPVALATNNLERMRIDGSGNVGIGKTDPQSPLNVRTGTDQVLWVRSGSSPSSVWLTSINDANNAYVPMKIDGLTLLLNSGSGAGNVGIGTTSPNAKLEVSRTSADTNTDTEMIRISQFTSGTPTAGLGSRIVFLAGNGGGTATARIKSTWQAASSGDLTLQTVNGGSVVDALHIKSDGSVGVGTVSPGAKFHIAGGQALVDNDNAYLFKDASGNPTIGIKADTSNNLTFATGSTYGRMAITTAGNVGIGDTTPAAMLTVGSGDLFQVNSSGAIAAATGITTSGNVTLSTAPTTSAGTYTILTRNSSTGVVESVASTLMPTGSGTTNYVARWTGTNTLGTGVIQDNGTNVGIGTAASTFKLEVAGSVGPSVTNTYDLGSSGVRWANVYATTATAVTVATGANQTITGSSGGNWDFTNSSGGGWYMNWIQNGATAMRLSTSNNLLIGTTTDNSAGKLQVAGNVVPATDNTHNLGSASYRWANIYATNIAMTSLTQGSVTFAGASGAISQDNANFFWDDTNNRLGVGTATPGYKLHVVSAQSAAANNTLTGAAAVFGTTLGIREHDATAGISGDGYSTQVYQGNSSGGNLEIYNVAATYGLVFGTNTTERMRISSGGNVGIGSNNPQQLLHMSSSSTAGTSLRIDNTDTSGRIFRLISTGSGNSTGAGSFGIYDETGSDYRLVISSTGNVGIGTTSPSQKLDVNTYAILIGSDNATNGLRTNATAKSGRFLVSHYTNSEEPVTAFLASSTSSANEIIVGGGTSLGNAATNISFYTAANNTTTTGTERMRIDSAGNVGIGATSPANKLDVSGSIGLAVDGLIGFAGAGTTLTASNYAFSGNSSLTIMNVATAGTISMRVNNSGVATFKSTGLEVLGTGLASSIKLQNTGVITFASAVDYNSYALYGDTTNTIVNTPTGGAISFRTNNAVKAIIDSSGNFGIGTASPLSQLSNTNSTGGMSGANTTGIAWKSTANDYAAVIWGAPASGAGYGLRLNTSGQTSSDYPLYISSGATGGTAVMVARGDGNVGIGTTTPGESLDISSATPIVRVDSTNPANSSQVKLSYNGSDTHGLTLSYNGNSALSYIDATYPSTASQAYSSIIFRRNVGGVQTETMRIYGETGYVGIGDASPAAMFTVGSGDLFQVNSSGAIAAATGITTSGSVTLSTAPTTSAGTYTILTRNSSTGVVESISSTAMPGGSGTTNYIARWTGTNTLGTGLLQDNGTVVSIDASPISTSKLYVYNNAVTNAAVTDIAQFYHEENNSGNRADGRVTFKTGNNTGSHGDFYLQFKHQSANSTPSLIDGGYIRYAFTDTAAGSSYIAFANRSTTTAERMFLNGNTLTVGEANAMSSIYLNYPSTQTADQIISVLRTQNGGWQGANLSVQAGTAQNGGSNLNGGTLKLRGGLPTGSGSSNVEIYATGGGSSGTSDNTTQTMLAQFRGADGTIYLNGNTGIGTSSPGAPLQVNGGTAMTAGWNRTMMLDATYPVLGMHSGTKYGGVGFDNGTMYWWTNATTTDISAASVAMFLNSSGQLTAGAFIKSGGTSSQFLKADGSIDTNTYLTSATGVSSITGTANQVIASAATGAVTLSLPQNIHTAATPTFAGVYTTGNVGVGDATPASLLTVGSGDLFQVNSSGAIAAAAGITTSGTVTLSTAPTTSAGTYTILTRNSSTGVVESVASTTYAAGSGLSNYVARWTGTNTLSYGLIYDDGSNVGFNTATPQSFVQITRDVTDYADLDTYAQFEITSDEEPSQRLALGHYAGNGFIQALTTGSQYDNLLLNVKGGSVGVGVDTPAATFSVGTGSDSNFRVASTGNVTGSFTQLNGSSTANGSGSNSTTLVVASGTNFDVGNYVRVSSTSCATSVNICYAKITAKSTNTLTISPALTWANASAVVEMNIPEIGGSNTTSTLANRFGRGYFIDGIVTGNGTTFITENGITLSNRDTFEFKKGTSNMFTMDKNASYMDYKFYSHVGNSNLNLSSTSTENQLIVMGAGDTTALAFTGSTSQTTFTLNDEGNNEAFAFSASSSGSSSLSLKYGGSTYLDVYGDGTSGYLSFTNPGGDEFMHIDTDVANRKSWIGRAGTPTDFVFGISNEDPSKLLHVGSSSYTLTDIVARFESSSGTCDVDIASAGWACSSDERLKKNITTLEGTILDQVLALRPVTYNWLKHDEEVDQKYIGFIAQEVEEIFPDLVKTDDESGFKSLNYGGLMPYTIAAIQEMNIQVAAIPKLEDQTLYEKVSTFLRGIAERGEAVADSIRSKKVQTEQLCVGVDSDQVCLTKDQLQQLLNNSGSSGTSYSAPTSSTPTAEAAEPETATSGEAAASETPEETTVISEEETVESAPVEESEPAPESEPVVSAPIE